MLPTPISRKPKEAESFFSESAFGSDFQKSKAIAEIDDWVNRSRATPRPVLSKKKLDSQNQKFSFHFFKKKGRAQIQNPKSRENFLVLKLKFFWEKFQAELLGGDEKLKVGIGIFFKKSSNFVQ